MRIASAHATREGSTKLGAALAACRQARGNQLNFVAADMEFHRSIAEMSGNSLITALSHGLTSWMMRFRHDLVSARGAEQLTLDEHDKIYRAVAAGDSEAAATAMTEHLTRANALYSVLIVRDRERAS